MRAGILISILALAACGDDSGGGGADAPEGGGGDGGGEVADAPELPDAQPPDAGGVPGLDQVCSCATPCPTPLDCYVSTPSPPHFPECGTDAGIGESGVCRPRVASCDTNAMDCPFPSHCLDFSDGVSTFGVCAPAVGDDEMCRPELCADGFFCVGNSDDVAFCREDCGANPAACDANETCTMVGAGSGARMACLPNG